MDIVLHIVIFCRRYLIYLNGNQRIYLNRILASLYIRGKRINSISEIYSIRYFCCHTDRYHRSIQQLKEGVKKLQVDDGWGWIESLFGDWGVSGWLKGLIKIGLILLCAICGLLLIIQCLLPCLQRALQRMINTAFWIEK